MKIVIPAVILFIIAAAACYRAFGTHKQDPHYYAAACVVVNAGGAPPDDGAFKEKLRAVIISENSSYAVKKVEFDEASAKGAIARYRHADAAQKATAQQSTDACLDVLMKENVQR